MGRFVSPHEPMSASEVVQCASLKIFPEDKILPELRFDLYGSVIEPRTANLQDGPGPKL